MSPPPPVSPSKRAPSATTTTNKRRRLAAAPPWASLPGDLVQQIGWRLLAAGGLRFLAACSGWHSTTASPHCRGILDPQFHPRRWMILPEGPDGDLLPGGKSNLNGGDLRFLHLSTDTLVAVYLPLLAGDEIHSLLDSTDSDIIWVAAPGS
uniref:F-box domain-containing protein n=1 Tax=Leersia perrieri TaxID=77586 RepID=A0A0D9X182_9ORYZ